MINLAKNHSQNYSEISQIERLNCLEISAGSFLHIKRTVRERLKRESLIPDEDIEHTVKQIIKYPFLGGVKGSLKLQSDEKALIGATFYKEIKQQLKSEAEKEIFKRKEQSELEKNQYKRYVEKNDKYEKILPQEKHEVWAIDYVTFLLYGIYFSICVVYDVFSQAYLAIKASEVGTSQTAKEALKSAIDYSGTKPLKYLLSDNGKPFICSDFYQLLQILKISGQQIPPGEPWYNGALESGNRDLKKVLYTIAFHDVCREIEVSMRGVGCQTIFTHFETYCSKAQEMINEQIVRPKFKTTPMDVLTDKVKEKTQKRTAFITKKQQERKQRMELLKKKGGCKNKSIEEKVRAAWEKISASLNNDELFSFNELINERYCAVTI